MKKYSLLLTIIIFSNTQVTRAAQPDYRYRSKPIPIPTKSVMVQQRDYHEDYAQQAMAIDYYSYGPSFQQVYVQPAAIYAIQPFIPKASPQPKPRRQKKTRPAPPSGPSSASVKNKVHKPATEKDENFFRFDPNGKNQHFIQLNREKKEKNAMLTAIDLLILRQQIADVKRNKNVKYNGQSYASFLTKEHTINISPVDPTKIFHTKH